jgi:hypothetical protein
MLTLFGAEKVRSNPATRGCGRPAGLAGPRVVTAEDSPQITLDAAGKPQRPRDRAERLGPTRVVVLDPSPTLSTTSTRPSAWSR